MCGLYFYARDFFFEPLKKKSQLSLQSSAVNNTPMQAINNMMDNQGRLVGLGGYGLALDIHKDAETKVHEQYVGFNGGASLRGYFGWRDLPRGPRATGAVSTFVVKGLEFLRYLPFCVLGVCSFAFGLFNNPF